ncbi:uncharacterized protein LOC101855264 [Aplysia californica]|uniref:Uncharacterized protein LOC101855264 n=1 Tax=Aplysia californica TaxID=6500 RepID=A0ABM0JSE2_APLCA|nr:uncharacterized protein LOC101855264 [Aplysia californica]
MGLMPRGNRRDYWTLNWLTESPGFRKVKPRDRFLGILRYLHFQGNSAAIQDKEHRDYDKLYKVRSVLSSVVTKYQSVYKPNREISLDESMIACKSKFGFRKFMKDKPIRRGIKVFDVAESSSGYVCNLKVYTGKDDNEMVNSPIFDVVVDLTKPFHNLGDNLFFDTLYSSALLFKELLKKGIVTRNSPCKHERSS